MIEVVHITAHMGGGVGKVLSRLCAQAAARKSEIRHTLCCLEDPEKKHFLNHVRDTGCEIVIRPSPDRLQRLLWEADIVQLEWWHHPVVAGWLCRDTLPPMRLLVWSHVSGLYPPEIPLAFLTAPHRFVFSSPCSWEHPHMRQLDEETMRHIQVVPSSGGFDELPPPLLRSHKGPIRIGYVGTLNFAKLHPNLLDFVEAVSLPGFRLVLVGDPTNAEELLACAARRGLSDKIHLAGYTTDVADALAQFDVLAYLLNPLHYGTTENALLEAMAMGVVPVVLNNPVERFLVRHLETGLVVDSPVSFADALTFLQEQPKQRLAMAANACQDVRRRFALENTVTQWETLYRAVIGEPKRAQDFRAVFGEQPGDWFLACQGRYARWFQAGEAVEEAVVCSSSLPHFFYEPNKGSIFHYQRVYPTDTRLCEWALKLQNTRAPGWQQQCPILSASRPMEPSQPTSDHGEIAHDGMHPTSRSALESTYARA